MNIELDEVAAWAIVLTMLIAGVSAALIVGIAETSQVKVECYKAQAEAAKTSARLPEPVPVTVVACR